MKSCTSSTSFGSLWFQNDQNSCSVSTSPDLGGRGDDEAIKAEAAACCIALCRFLARNGPSSMFPPLSTIGAKRACYAQIEFCRSRHHIRSIELNPIKLMQAVAQS